MRSLLCIKRDVEDTGFPEPKYEVLGVLGHRPLQTHFRASSLYLSARA